MPSFGGVDIFGRAVSFVRQDNPREAQRVGAAGVNGVAVLDLGDRGRVTQVTGLLVGVNAAALNAAELLFESYKDGLPRSLVDSYGNTWLFVRLERFLPQGRIRQDGKWGYNRPYQAEFFHLI